MHYNAHILNKPRSRLEDVIPLETPFTLLVEVSRLCNFQCRFCPQSKKETFPLFKKNMLEMDDFKLIVSQMKEFPQTFKKVYMHGTGESLINPALPEMIRFLKESGTAESIDLTTNGSILTEELGRRLVEAGLNHLHLSVEAMSSEGYQRIAGAAWFDFDKFTEQIRAFSRQRNNCRFTIKLARVGLESEENREQFLSIFGPMCDEIFVENILPIWPDFQLPEQVEARNGNIGQYGQNIREKKVCPQIFTVLAVKCDGSVSPCSVDWGNKLALGNIHHETLRQIWAGEKLRHLRMTHLTAGRSDQSECAVCGLPKYACVDDLDAYADKLARKIIQNGGRNEIYS